MSEEYVVQQGDCLSSIAYKRGLTWETIWNYPPNNALKQQRKDPNILKPEDVLVIPERDLKSYSKQTNKLHKFRRKGTPAKLRLRIIEEVPPDNPPPPADESSPGADPLNPVISEPEYDPSPRQDRPRANVPFLLIVDRRLSNGQTDSDGYIECFIPPDASSARLILEPGTLREREIPLQLGSLNPISEISGVNHRLNNLGFTCGETSDEVTPELRSALEDFQTKYGLQVTGEVDQATRDKLRELHGG